MGLPKIDATLSDEAIRLAIVIKQGNIREAGSEVIAAANNGEITAAQALKFDKDIREAEQKALEEEQRRQKASYGLGLSIDDIQKHQQQNISILQSVFLGNLPTAIAAITVASAQQLNTQFTTNVAIPAASPEIPAIQLNTQGLNMLQAVIANGRTIAQHHNNEQAPADLVDAMLQKPGIDISAKASGDRNIFDLARESKNVTVGQTLIGHLLNHKQEKEKGLLFEEIVQKAVDNRNNNDHHSYFQDAIKGFISTGKAFEADSTRFIHEKLQGIHMGSTKSLDSLVSNLKDLLTGFAPQKAVSGGRGGPF